MDDPEEQFATRLAADLERVLGAGVSIDDVELTATDGAAHVRATILIDGRIQTIEASGPDAGALYRPLMERAAELRLGAAFWRIVGPG